jgi:hypothetical protein
MCHSSVVLSLNLNGVCYLARGVEVEPTSAFTLVHEVWYVDKITYMLQIAGLWAFSLGYVVILFMFRFHYTCLFALVCPIVHLHYTDFISTMHSPRAYQNIWLP